jgi:serine/threonine protein kinase
VIPKGGRPYIAMDLLKGTALSGLLMNGSHLPYKEAIPIFKQVCSALGEAHRQGIVHRDIKPENIVLVERSGQKLFPIVVDFGIARLIQEDSEYGHITRTGTVCGSPTYMSPEQCTSSKVDHRSDMYSLAIVIYETLTGQVPFLSDELVKVMSMHLSDAPTPLNSVCPDLQFPKKLEEVISRALSKSPHDRYESMDDFAIALEEAAKQPEVSILPFSTNSGRDTAILVPGPLASSDEFSSRKEMRDTAASITFAPLTSKPRELANRALEELAQRSSGIYDQISNDQIISNRANSVRATDFPNLPNEQFVRRRINRPIVRLKQAARHNSMTIITAIAMVTIVVFAANNNLAEKFFFSKGADQAQSLIKQGKLEDALPIMQDLQRHGKLSQAQIENLNKACVNLAKQYAKQKRFLEAIALLEQVPAKSNQSGAAKTLINKYKSLKPGSNQH